MHVVSDSYKVIEYDKEVPQSETADQRHREEETTNKDCHNSIKVKQNDCFTNNKKTKNHFTKKTQTQRTQLEQQQKLKFSLGSKVAY